MSSQRGTIRKVFDIGPASFTSNGSYDGSGSPTTSWSSGILTNNWLTSIPQSDNDNGRVGQSVALESFDLRVNVYPQSSVAMGDCRLRMLVVADHEYDGMNSAGSAAAPLLSEILGVAQNTGLSVASGAFLFPLNPGFFSRFKVIEDKRWQWRVSSAPNAVECENTHSFYHESFHEMHSHRLMWDVTDADTIGSARNGHIFIYFIFESQATQTGGLPLLSTGNPPAITYFARFRYRDA